MKSGKHSELAEESMEKLRLRKKTVVMSYFEGKRQKSKWHWKDFLKDADWFATMCNLPHAANGLVPEEIPEQLVSGEMLRECFLEHQKGFMMSPTKIIPAAQVHELVCIVEGPGNVQINRISTAMAKGIYADRVLGLSVNWASYAHRKHKSRLLSAWTDGLPPPSGPPLVRVPVRYKPPPPLNPKVGSTLKAMPVWSESPADSPIECSTSRSIESAAYKRSPNFTDHSRDGLKTDGEVKTGQCSSKAVPTERETIHLRRDENLRNEAPRGASGQQPLLCTLTSEKIQEEISSLIQQHGRLQKEVSTLRSILELVSK